MKTLFNAAAAALTGLAAFVLVSCAAAMPIVQPSLVAAPAPVQSMVVRADQVILSGERAFALAERVYTVAAHGAGLLVDAGVIRGQTAVTVRGWNAEARNLLINGKVTADAAERARDAARLLTIADNLDALKRN